VLWRIFTEIRPVAGANGSVEIPMQNFVRVAERFLIEAKRQENGDPVVSEPQLADFVGGTYFAALPQRQEEEDDEERLANE
jgi:hypothetical protein